MLKLRHNEKLQALEWETPYKYDLIGVDDLPEDGAALVAEISSLQAMPLKRDRLQIATINGPQPAQGWRLGVSDFTLVKIRGGYNITHRPTGLSLEPGPYPTRADAVADLPRAVVKFKRTYWRAITEHLYTDWRARCDR